MQGYFHSVTLERDSCKGCTTCITRCPVEAIRVRGGKACIITERCIDCGVCIRACPSHAKTALVDPLSLLEKFSFPVAIPAPSLFGQFDDRLSTDRILSAFLDLGFRDVYEAARAADAVAGAVAGILSKKDCVRPLISSSCPAVVRLVQVRFPSLTGNIVPVESPMEAAARYVKTVLYPGKPGLGCFFITPCPAKMTSIRSGTPSGPSSADGAFSVKDIVYPLKRAAQKAGIRDAVVSRASSGGLSWGTAEGELSAVRGGTVNVSVDGIHQVIALLEDVENGRLTDIDYIEASACRGGCTGGPLQAVNTYAARSRLKRRAGRLPRESRMSDAEAGFYGKSLFFKSGYPSSPVLHLNDDLPTALRLMEELEKLEVSLPGLDCGSCGAPRCRALAEDVVKGNADPTDCIFVLREKIRHLTVEMVKLEGKMPPSFDLTKKKIDKRKKYIDKR